MKRRLLSALLAAMVLLSMLPVEALAVSEPSDDITQSEQDIPATVSDEAENSSTDEEENPSIEPQTMAPQSNEDAEQPTVTTPSYEVSTAEELGDALTQIAASESGEARKAICISLIWRFAVF